MKVCIVDKETEDKQNDKDDLKKQLKQMKEDSIYQRDHMLGNYGPYVVNCGEETRKKMSRTWWILLGQVQK